jgi:ribose 5-phosphate isomerase B
VADSPLKPTIAIGADHAGFRTKEIVKKYLEGEGYSLDDIGAFSEESVDYPDYARQVAERVGAEKNPWGILICGTGIGMAIAANKVVGVRAGVAHDSFTARRAREHNNCNVITFGGKTVGDDEAIEIVKEFLSAQFAGARHQRRVDKIREIEQARAQKA